MVTFGTYVCLGLAQYFEILWKHTARTQKYDAYFTITRLQKAVCVGNAITAAIAMPVPSDTVAAPKANSLLSTATYKTIEIQPKML